EKLVNVLENKTGFGISTGNGEVTLDLHALLIQIGQELGISDSALAKIPADQGVITLMSSDQLSLAQDAVRALRILSVWLLVIVLGMYALAVYLARGARRVALARVGWAFVIVGAVVLVARHLLGNYVIHALTTENSRDAGTAVWAIGTSILGDIAW